MLKFITAGRRLCGTMISVSLLTILASCSAEKVNEETFSLYLNGRSYDELIESLKIYASGRDYYLTSENLSGRSSENLSRHIMLRGNDTRFLIQSALSEQCEEREGRREVAYSRRVFDVNIFSTSYFQSASHLSKQANQLKEMLVDSGFRVVPKSESCELL